MADLVARISARDLQGELPLDRLVDYLRLLRAEDGVSQQMPDELALEVAHMVFDHARPAAAKRALERRCGLPSERVQVVVDHALCIKGQASKRSRGRAQKGQSGKAGRPGGAGREEDPATCLAMNLMILEGLSLEQASTNACLMLAGRDPTPQNRAHVEFGDDQYFADDEQAHELRKQAERVRERLASQGGELQNMGRAIVEDMAASVPLQKGLNDQVDHVREHYKRT